MQILIIKRLLSLPSSQRLRLKVLCFLQKPEYKLSKKNYLQTNAFPDSSGGSVREITSTAINESHWRSYE